MPGAGLYMFLIAALVAASSQALQLDEMNNSNATERSLSRKRRYLVFPSGSSLQLVYCLTVPSVGVGQIFTLGYTAALAWELPDKAEFILNLKDKKFPTTTEAPETTTLPHLHHDYDYQHGFDHDYDHYGAAPPPLERFDKPTKWKSPQQSGRPSAVNNRKTYYDPFFISRPGTSSVFGHGPVKAVSNQAGNGGWRNSIIGSGSRGKVTYRAGNRPKSGKYPATHSNRWDKENTPITTYIHPVYHQHYRRTRRDLYGKVEKLFTALSKDGKSCLLKAICEVSQVAQRKGSFMEEIIKAVFRVKPHENYPDEDEYDTAANRNHNCTEKYPTCDGSIWSSMLGY